jgi:regulator of sirC expression with transglutaminase-like and TPR domain
MTAASRQRFAALVREDEIDLGLACALIAVEADPSLEADAAVQGLDDLAARLPATGTGYDRLRAVLGEFHGDAEDFADLRASLLPEVLRRRRGLPILLSVVWLEVARRAEVDAFGASMPGHYVVGLGDPDGDHTVIDPFRGGRPVTLTAPPARWTEVPTLLRILTNVRTWAGSADRIRTALWATELALLLPGHPAELRAEHGRLLARTGDYRRGADELEAYADVVDSLDAETATAVRREARMARARLN